jgi:hypothetical protein
MATPYNEAGDSTLTQRGIAIACITIARYLRTRDPSFRQYLDSSLEHAESSGLAKEDWPSCARC